MFIKKLERRNTMIENDLREQIVQCYEHTGNIVVVYDTDSALSTRLVEEFKLAYPQGTFHLFGEDTKPFLDALTPTMVVLIQSSSFRITKDRLRVDLCLKGHKVMEFVRLERVQNVNVYLEALRFDSPRYRALGRWVSSLDGPITITSGDCTFTVPESDTWKFNDGYFDKLYSAGFPIGEAFTEAKDLDSTNGTLKVFGFPNMDIKLQTVDPFTMKIENGRVVSHTGPQAFEDILQMIRDVEGDVIVREIGFGFNRAMGPGRTVAEPTAFERFEGVHVSLGKKHALYRKKISKKVYQKYHIDCFCMVEKISIGDTMVFNGEFEAPQQSGDVTA